MKVDLPPAARLVSLDALRGFDMLWILGADSLASAFSALNGGPVSRFVAWQLEHSVWEGFHFYDLIFPLFIFMAGAAIPLSLDKIVARDGRQAAVKRLLRRGLLMFVLGLLFYGGIAQGYAHVRLLGVLQRLAICYVATGLFYLFLSPRGLIGICAVLLAGYWALLTFVPVPGFGPGDFARGHNLANWVDVHYLPFKLWYGDYDPEGLLSTLPAIASCLLGVFAGLFLRDEARPPTVRVHILLFSGVVLIALGHLWGLQFPVIKRIWTSSFVLVAGGWSAVLLAIFYYIIDLRGWKSWAQPLVWVGTNALPIYLVSHVVNFADLSNRFFGGEVASALNAVWTGLGGLVLALTGIFLCVLLCRFLYERKIVIRL